MEETNEWHSCFAVAFNRRGNYIASGHGSGAVPFHDFASRTLSSIFTPPQPQPHPTLKDSSSSPDDCADQERLFQNGITSISWSRRSRHVLVASFGDRHVCLLDNSHPFGVKDAFVGLTTGAKGSRPRADSMSMSISMNMNRTDRDRDRDRDSPVTKAALEKVDDDMDGIGNAGSQDAEDTHFVVRQDARSAFHTSGEEGKDQLYRRARYVTKTSLLKSKVGGDIESNMNMEDVSEVEQTARYQTLVVPLPEPLGVCAQIHPSGNGGLACLEDGSLIVFNAPTHAFQGSASDAEGHFVYLSLPRNSSSGSSVDDGEAKSFHVTCATFDAHGHCVYAATKCGKLLLFRLDKQFERALFQQQPDSTNLEAVSPTNYSRCFSNYVYIEVGGSSAANQIVLSKNGQKLLLNCKDSLKLYDTAECWKSTPVNKDEITVNPRLTFQDVVSKSKWYACDFSGDGEYVVGGCNNEESGDKYELYFWNTTTGKFLSEGKGFVASINGSLL